MPLNTDLQTVIQRTGGTTDLATPNGRSAFITAVRRDLANLIGQMNTVHYQLARNLISEPGLDAIASGLSGNVIKANVDASADGASIYWNGDQGRASSVKEALDVVVSEISRLENAIASTGGGEISAIRDFIGMDTPSGTTSYSDHGAITTVVDGDSLEEAIQKLDAAIDGGGGGFAWSKIVTVDASGGADYTTIQAAINYCVTQTPSLINQYFVVVNPGWYSEDLTFAPFVHLVAAVPSTGNPYDLKTVVSRASVGHQYTPASTGAMENVFVSGFTFVEFGPITTYPQFRITGSYAPMMIFDHCGFGGFDNDSNQKSLIWVNGANSDVTLQHCTLYGVGTVEPTVYFKGTDAQLNVQYSFIQSNHVAIRFNPDANDGMVLQTKYSQIRGDTGLEVGGGISLIDIASRFAGNTYGISVTANTGVIDNAELDISTSTVEGGISLLVDNVVGNRFVWRPPSIRGAWTVSGDVLWQNMPSPVESVYTSNNTYNLPEGDENIFVITDPAGATTLILPVSTGLTQRHTRWIKDMGDASTYDLIIQANGSERIEGNLNLQILDAHGAVGLHPYAGGWSIISQKGSISLFT